jgi:hypothetical protein
MMATIGLSRLEVWLGCGAVTACDVADFLEQAEAVDVRPLARVGRPEALNDEPRRPAGRFPG